MRPVAAIPAVLLLLLLLPHPAPAAGAKWTFLVYLDADNNLESVGVDDFLEMASVGSSADVNVVVQFDRSTLNGPGDGGTRAYDDWTDTKRFFVTQGMIPDAASALPWPATEANMADPQTLVAFLEWAIPAYPADHYFLDLWDHGTGWTGVVTDGGDILTPEEIAWALDTVEQYTGERIDVLGNDACRMSLEIMFELRQYVDFFVGSEKDSPLEGWPYDRFLEAWTADPGMAPSELAVTLVDAYYDSYLNQTPYAVALAAVSAASLDALAGRLTAFADEVLAYFPYFSQEFQDARTATERYEVAGQCCGDEFDLYHFAENAEAYVPSPRLARLARDLRAAITAAVAYERHWDNPTPVNAVRATHAHGLSIFFPSGSPPSAYADLALSRNTSWDEFLAGYGGGIPLVRGLTATLTPEDADGDGLQERFSIVAVPAVDGLVAVEVTGPRWSLSIEQAAAAGEESPFRVAPPVPGAYGVAVYLFEGGKLRNLVSPGTAAVEAWRVIQGTLTMNGTGADGSVTLQNLRTGQSVTVPARAGAFTATLAYPTWIADGDALRVTARASGKETAFTVVPDLATPTTPLQIAMPAAAAGPDPLLALLLGAAVGAAAAAAPFLVRDALRARRRNRLLQ